MPRAHRTDAAPRGLARVERHEERLAWPLFIASFLWIGSITVVWVDPHPSGTVRFFASLIIAVTWIWFIIDYLVRLALAKSERRRFLRSRAFDLATLVIPLLRPFMILVAVWRLPVFKKGGAERMRARYAVVTVLFAFLYVYVCSYLVWAAEKGTPHASIVNFGDALWWGFTTIATVGYGDYVPITIPGRVFAVGLMVGGIVVVGFVTATLLSALTDRIRRLAIPEAEQRSDDEHSEAG